MSPIDETQEASIMSSASIDGTPFSVLMSQAIKLKSAQEAPRRSIYDNKYPTFYKNSMFPHEEVLHAREKKLFRDRMKDAIRMKEEGNSRFEEGNYLDAIHKYEMAVSVFKYLENVNPNWKTEV